MSKQKDLRDRMSKVAADVAGYTKKAAQDAARKSGDSLHRLQQRGAHKELGLRIERATERMAKELEEHAPTWQPKIQAVLQAKTDKPARLIANAISGLGRRARQGAPLLGGTTTGALGGLFKSGGGLFDVFINETELSEMEARCAQAAKSSEQITSEQNAAIREAVEKGDKEQLLDMLTVGGITLSAATQLPGAIPPQIEEAYSRAYPRQAEGGETFSEAIADKSPEELIGLISGVKGKLFEIQLVDQLNAGQLEDGLHASLAFSSNQPGYDIQILDEEGEVVDEIQAKATESVAYVQQAIERYPSIDVVTTSEVYGDLLSAGAVAGVIDSGITESELHSQIHSAVAPPAEVGIEDFAPSALGLALIAFSAFRKKHIPLEERGAEFGDRGARVAVASSLGAGAMFATGVGALGFIAGIGAHSAANIGAERRRRYEALKSITERLEGSNQRNASRLIKARQ